MKLSELQIGDTATILSVGGEGALRQHFLDMGLIQGTEVTVVSMRRWETLWNFEFTDTSCLFVWQMLKIFRSVRRISRRKENVSD